MGTTDETNRFELSLSAARAAAAAKEWPAAVQLYRQSLGEFPTDMTKGHREEDMDHIERDLRHAESMCNDEGTDECDVDLGDIDLDELSDEDIDRQF